MSLHDQLQLGLRPLGMLPQVTVIDRGRCPSFIPVQANKTTTDLNCVNVSETLNFSSYCLSTSSLSPYLDINKTL